MQNMILQKCAWANIQTTIAYTHTHTHTHIYIYIGNSSKQSKSLWGPQNSEIE